MWAGMRDRLIKTRTQVSNAIRSYAAEFGLVAAKGARQGPSRCWRGFAASEDLPAAARDALALHGREYARAAGREVREVEAKLMAWHRGNQDSRKSGRSAGYRADRRDQAGDEEGRCHGLPIGPILLGLDRTDGQGPFQRPAGSDWAASHGREIRRSGACWWWAPMAVIRQAQRHPGEGFAPGCWRC